MHTVGHKEASTTVVFRWITVTRQTDHHWSGKWVLSTDHRPPGGLLSLSPPYVPSQPLKLSRASGNVYSSNRVVYSAPLWAINVQAMALIVLPQPHIQHAQYRVAQWAKSLYPVALCQAAVYIYLCTFRHRNVAKSVSA